MPREKFSKFCIVCSKLTDARPRQNWFTFSWDNTYKTKSGKKVACCNYCAIYEKQKLREKLTDE